MASSRAPDLTPRGCIMKTFTSILLLIPASLLAPLDGPTERIHRLMDGTQLQGRARVTQTEVRIQTPFGDRVVPRRDYVGPQQVRLEDLKIWYRGATDAVADRDLAGHRRIAEECRARGYMTGLRRELNAILKTDTDDRWARALLDRLAKDYRVHKLEGSSKGRDLRRYIDFLFEDLARRDNVGAVFAGSKVRGLPDDLVYRPAMKALKHSKPRVRWLGAHVLRAFGGKPNRVQELFRRSLQDGVWAVRRECVRSLKATGDSSLVKLYEKQLTNPKQTLQVRSAQALGELGFEAAARPLVKALADTWRPNRVHIVNTRQVAYVKDYDVEVAQTAFIADPVVDVLQEGTVLEVALISVSVVRRVYRGALVRVTGADFGVDPKKWRAHLDGK